MISLKRITKNVILFVLILCTSYSCNSSIDSAQEASQISEQVNQRYLTLQKNIKENQVLFNRIIEESQMPAEVKLQSKAALTDIQQSKLSLILKKQNASLTDESANEMMNQIDETIQVMYSLELLKNPTLNKGKPWDL